jgi:hypothetical protein
MFCTGFNNTPSGAISMGLMSLPISWETTLTYPIIILILYGVLLLYGNRKPHCSSSHSLNDSAEIVFLPGCIWRVVPIGVLSISLLMIYIYRIAQSGSRGTDFTIGIIYIFLWIGAHVRLGSAFQFSDGNPKPCGGEIFIPQANNRFRTNTVFLYGKRIPSRF